MERLDHLVHRLVSPQLDIVRLREQARVTPGDVARRHVVRRVAHKQALFRRKIKFLRADANQPNTGTSQQQFVQ